MLRHAPCLLLVALTGCGRIGFGLVERDAGDGDTGAVRFDAGSTDADRRDAPSLDASVDAPAAADAGPDAEIAVDAGPIFATGPFERTRLVEELRSTAREDDPSLTGDLLEIYFDSDRSGGMGGGDIWMSSRTSVDAPWMPPVNVTALNSSGDDATPDVAPDGLTLYYVTARAGAIGAKDVYVSTRASRTDAWSPPVHVPEVSTSGDEAGPSVREDGLAIYLGSDIAGGDDLYHAERASTGVAFDPPNPVDELNTSSSEAEPWIARTGRFLAFASNRAGGMGGSDLYIASRDSTALPFAAPRSLDGVNTSADETDPWLSADGTILFFARSGDIYTATR